MFRERLARLFRELNANLLYTSPLSEKLLKIPFFISTRFYKHWKKKPRAQTWKIVKVDKTISMKVDISKSMGAAFYWMGFHELNESRFLHSFLKPGMTLIDIGANQGEFALFAAKRLTSGEVLAFEPMNVFYELLTENITLNNFTNVKAFHFGLSDVEKRVPIYLGSAGAGEHEGLGTIFQSEQRNRLVQEIEIKIFDDFIAKKSLASIDFIKIDVEGAELMVLNGARKSIEKFRPPVMIEMNEDTFRSAGYSSKEIREYFKSLHYSMYQIRKAGKLHRTDAIPDFCNVVFMPNA